MDLARIVKTLIYIGRIVSESFTSKQIFLSAYQTVVFEKNLSNIIKYKTAKEADMQ